MVTLRPRCCSNISVPFVALSGYLRGADADPYGEARARNALSARTRANSLRCRELVQYHAKARRVGQSANMLASTRLGALGALGALRAMGALGAKACENLHAN